MVDCIGENGFDDSHIINNLGGEGEQFAIDPSATFSFLGEVEFRRSNREACLAAGHGGKSLATLHGGWKILIEEILEGGFIIPEVDLRGRTVHMEIDDGFSSGLVVGQPCDRFMNLHLLCVGFFVVCHHHAKGKRTEPKALIAEELPSGLQHLIFKERIHESSI